MFSFLVKRLYQALVVMFVISLVAFAIQDNLGILCVTGWSVCF
ncbi:peptide ABC transporter [Vibrio sp. JCM 19236]|nr:peptide ABC transporter [Vibrio sp. JCM 19236]